MIEKPTIPLAEWPGLSNVKILRGDLIHPIVSGNKLYKLLPIIDKARSQNKSTLISVGGRYSNHLHALAWAGREFNFNTVGVVRGFSAQELTPTLMDCITWGMSIHFVDFQMYEQRYSPEFWQPWLDKYDRSFPIYEGGWSEEAIAGSKSWWRSIPSTTDVVICAIGSGSTFSGLLMSAPYNVEVIGVPVFKDPDQYTDLRSKITGVTGLNKSLPLWEGFAGRGFGKLSAEQKNFKVWFEGRTGIPLDPVYTAKAFYALHTQLALNPSLQNKNIVIMHSGGLQGNRT
ncbi:MAG: hypothetical protein P8X79_08990 [Reinekea sp.]